VVRGKRPVILGAGITGLAAGYASGLPVFEAADWPGGICSSYYMRPGGIERLHRVPEDAEAYRFEIGGGHWIFGGDPLVLRFIRSLTPVKSYERRSAVYLPEKELLVPYPLQNHLRYLGPGLARQALEEIASGQRAMAKVATMADWLRFTFGPTLCELFFDPFHELYTAGLYREIAPQDSYKTPIELSLVVRGAFEDVPSVGYNVKFVYPEQGLNILVQRMSDRCDVRYRKRAVRIDLDGREVYFEDGTSLGYSELVSTIPLNRLTEMTGLDLGEPADPATSVLVLNIGAVRGPRCPSEHWLYIPRSRAGFHRVGFYSNVDLSFLPGSARARGDRVSVYVEKSYRQGTRLDTSEIAELCQEVIQELQDWAWIREVDVVDTTWIDVAYTWSWPGSKWRNKALAALAQRSIYSIGRYGSWCFQGIADSLKEGLTAGVMMAERDP
jgi:protoporphyrinogen oxidase